MTYPIKFENNCVIIEEFSIYQNFEPTTKKQFTVESATEFIKDYVKFDDKVKHFYRYIVDHGYEVPPNLEAAALELFKRTAYANVDNLRKSKYSKIVINDMELDDSIASDVLMYMHHQSLGTLTVELESGDLTLEHDDVLKLYDKVQKIETEYKRVRTRIRESKTVEDLHSIKWST